jgi:hypothetical protein
LRCEARRRTFGKLAGMAVEYYEPKVESAFVEWVSRVVADGRRRAARTPEGRPRLVYVGLQCGAIDAADDLSPSLRDSELLEAKPLVSSAEEADIDTYLAGYMAGHLMTTLFHDRSLRGLTLGGDVAVAIGRACAVYGAALATPRQQARLALGGVDDALAVHDYAARIVCKREAPLSEVLENAMLGWLMERQGFPESEFGSKAARYRQMRVGRSALAEGPAPPDAA